MMNERTMKRERMATCCECGRMDYSNNMVKTPSYKRGLRPIFTCERCATENKRYGSKNTENDGALKIRGTEYVHGIRVGVEDETSFSDEIGRATLFEYEMIPTNDSSLESDENSYRYGCYGSTCEYVSPVWNGMKIASKWALTMDRLVKDGHVKVNESCGTHFHVSINNMNYGLYMLMITEYYNELFAPLTETMEQHKKETIELFGRWFNEYASPIYGDTNWCDRYNFINVTNSNNIEFRLNKFVTGKQYQKLMALEVKMVETIVTVFCEHYNDNPEKFDKRRYKTVDQYRTHKAKACSKKLVAMFLKAINK